MGHKKPFTALRLESLGKGERYTFFRGNLNVEIEICNPRGSEKRGAPSYQQTLLALRETVEQLQRNGQIKVTLHPMQKRQYAGRFVMTYSYEAKGI